MNESPLVSILINNYNYGRFLGEAIDSALNQTYPHVEVIVVDDGSTDDSKNIIANYGNRIQPILKKNGGQASAFNAGFLNSQGDIICFLDADDAFVPEKVTEVVKVFKSNKDCGWCFHPQALAYTEDKISLRSNYTPKFIRHDLRGNMQRGKLGNPFVFLIPATSGMCFSRSLLQQILPMPESKGINLNDSYIKFVALGISKGAALDAKLSIQRIHKDNAFTLRNDKQKAAEIHILLAYWLRKKFPVLTKFANNLFAVGFADYSQFELTEVTYQEMITEYLALLTPIEKLRLKLKILFHSLKT